MIFDELKLNELHEDDTEDKMPSVNQRLEDVVVLSNECISGRLFLMEIGAPLLARNARPGQFFHLKIVGTESHILRRPFCVFYTDKTQGTVGILYQIMGAGTEEMSKWTPGVKTDLIGPIGCGWHIPDNCKRALLVGGGVGAAPLFMLYETLVSKGIETDVVLGSVNASTLAPCFERFTNVCGVEPRCSTDDGSFGIKGFCTDIARERIIELRESISDMNTSMYDYMAVCGPTPVMKLCSEIAESEGILCEVSMERKMACGIGACLSCVCETNDGRKRVCIDGPVFNSKEIKWL